METLLFAVALEVALQQMRIHEGSTELRLRNHKLGGKREKRMYAKLVKDRETSIYVIRLTLAEIAEKGQWGSLEKAIESLEQRFRTILAKRREHEELKLTKMRVMAEINTKRDEWTDLLQKADQKTALLRDKKQDDLLNASTRLRYAEMWLSARAEEQELRFQIENKPAQIPSKDHENRIYEEITKALTLQIQEREKLIEYWESRYKADIVDINQRLTKQRQQLLVITAKREDLQQLYNLHEGEMRSWLSFKEQRAARLAREERVRLSATRIQAWWRGNMVRRALGSFKYLKNLKKPPSKSKRK